MTSQPTPRAREFLPKLMTVFREGYGLRDLRADATAGLTVAIVALPLSMAIAIASGVEPERGLYTAIIGGFLVSALGGSRFQIGGPAGAFIVLVAACVLQTGTAGLLLATFLSGAILAGIGALRLGGYVRLIPYPVTVGFTAGIAVIIFASQIKDLFGLTLPDGAPSDFLGRLGALWQARATISPTATVLALATIAITQGVKRLRPHWPSMLIAIVAISAAAMLFRLPVETIATRFGALPRMPPAPALPDLSPQAIAAALPWAISFAILGAIESLLSAVVADGMTGHRHRPNAELVAQGAANIGSALFGGFCVTGTIARTATNVRAGSRGPVSGMLHAVFLLAFLMIAGPVAGHVPLAALAGVLAVVAWNMAEKHEIARLLRNGWADVVVLAVTFGLVVFRDLIEGILVGSLLACVTIVARLGAQGAIRPATDLHSDGAVLHQLGGALIFANVPRLGQTLDRLAGDRQPLVLDFAEVPFVDSSAAQTIALFVAKRRQRGGPLHLAGVTPEIRQSLKMAGIPQTIFEAAAP